jgi:cytochrome c peroxidase
MKSLKSLYAIGGTVIAGLVFSNSLLGAAPDAETLRARSLKLVKVIPNQMPGAEKDTPAQISLGKKLYNDTVLSSTKTMSCNTCHQLEPGKGGADDEATSEGVAGKRGDRNSPTVLNAGFQFAQFWDGRAPTLEEQAKGPILNPIEMAMSSDKEVLQRIEASADYPALFKQAFPGASPAITYDNVAQAIAAFERTLITRDRFDDFLKGDNNALNEQEIRGLGKFISSGCMMCHNGPLLGGNRYGKTGVVHPYPNIKDLGRYEVTKDEADKYKFKIPMLRNIAITGPYYHDGKVATLSEAVESMAWIQSGKKLSKEEVQDIVAFLKTLTDKERAKSAQK